MSDKNSDKKTIVNGKDQGKENIEKLGAVRGASIGGATVGAVVALCALFLLQWPAPPIDAAASSRQILASVGASPLGATIAPKPAQACTPPAPDMVAWWPMDEAPPAKVVEDIVGFANDGMPQPGPEVGPPNSPFAVFPGMVGGALGFVKPGLVQVSDHPDLNFSASESLTIDAWVKPVANPLFGSCAIVSKVSGNSGYALLLPGGPSNSILRFTMNGNVFDSFDTVTFNQWNHVAVTVDRTTNEVILYINGMANDSPPTPLGATPTPVVPLLIGQSQSPGPPQGELDIDELEIFKRALRLDEIQAIRDADIFGKCKFCVTPPANMVAWWPADGNTFDITPNPADGALSMLGATFAPGGVGQGFSLNGTTGFVEAADANKINFGALQDFSIDAWIKTSNAVGIQSIIDKRDGGFALLTGYHLFTSNGFLGVQLATNGAFLNFVSTTNPVADGRFHHVAVTVDRDTAGMLYVDGNQVHPFDPTARTGNLDNSAALRIGRRSPNNRWWVFQRRDRRG